jgi:hypothetical protein
MDTRHRLTSEIPRTDRRHRTGVRGFLALLVAVLATLATFTLSSPHPVSAQAAPTTTITATLSYQDTEGPKPIRFAEVEVWRRQNQFAFWGYVDTGRTDANGRLNLPVSYANGALYRIGVKAANYAVSVWPADNVVRTSPFMGRPGEPQTEIMRQETGPGQSLDFSYNFADPQYTRYYNLAETVRVGFDYARARRDPSQPEPLPPVAAQPWTGPTHYSPPLGVMMNHSQVMDDAVILHEYAHGLEDALSSFPAIGSIHSGCVSTRPVLGGVIDSPQLAWQEAFASWFAEAVRLANPTAGLVNLGGSPDAADLEVSPACVGQSSPGITGDALENRVAATLWDLLDSSNEPGDTLQGHDTTIMQIMDREQELVQGPGILNFRDAWIARGLPAAALDNVYRLNWILPTFTPLNPARLLETRPGQVTVDGQQQGIGLRAAGSTTEVQVTGRAGVPANATAVVLNVTVTETAGVGHVTAFPCGSPRPNASNLNYVAGQTVPNAVVAKVGSNGRVCLFTAAGTHLIADVSGYYQPGSQYAPLNPARLLETRPGQVTVDGQQQGIGRRAAGSTTEVQVTGRVGIPANATSVVLNVTVTGTAGFGHVTVYPCGSPRPNASNLNYVPGQTVPNTVVAKVGDNGRVCLFTAADTHLITDVSGFFHA